MCLAEFILLSVQKQLGHLKLHMIKSCLMVLRFGEMTYCGTICWRKSEPWIRIHWVWLCECFTLPSRPWNCLFFCCHFCVKQRGLHFPLLHSRHSQTTTCFSQEINSPLITGNSQSNSQLCLFFLLFAYPSKNDGNSLELRERKWLKWLFHVFHLPLILTCVYSTAPPSWWNVDCVAWMWAVFPVFSHCSWAAAFIFKCSADVWGSSVVWRPIADGLWIHTAAAGVIEI